MNASIGEATPRRCLWLTKGLGRGGVERLLLDMYPLVDENRFEVDVAYVLPWKDNYHAPLEEAGATVHCLGASHPADPRWVWRLASLLRARRYDLVHSHAPIPGVAARLTGLWPGGPKIVHTEHNMWDRYKLPTRLTNSATYWRNSAAIAVSDTVAATIDPWPPVRLASVEVVHHGTVLASVQEVEPEARAARRELVGLPVDSYLVGNVGNFTAKKDHRTLLEAMAGPGRIGSAHLVLIGLGPLRAELEAATSELGIADRVTFLGSRDDVFELLPLLDMFCMSSQFEGFPIALVEAMATGLPCVATTVGGIPEIIEDHRNGLLVEPGDPARLQAAIEEVMADDALAARLAKEAKVSAESLDLQNAVDELQHTYSTVLGDPDVCP